MDEASTEPLADELLLPDTDRSLRKLPKLVFGAVALVWRAGPRVLALTVGLQIVGSGALALQVVAGRFLLGDLIASSSTHDFHRAIPWLVVLAVTLAASAIISVLNTELQRLLSELVSRFSLKRVVDAATAADLIRFENPQFHDRLQRAVVNAAIRPLQMTTGLLTVGSSGFAALAVMAALISIQPLLLALGVVAVVPVTLMSLAVGRALYRFAIEQTPLDRRRIYLQQLLTQKDSAKEIRAYNLADYLGARFSSLYDMRIAALRDVVRTRIKLGVGGGILTGAVTGGTLGLLILLVSDRRMSLAGAGAAAAALLVLSSQLQGLAGGIGALYESALYIQDFNSFVDLIPALDGDRSTVPVPEHIGTIKAQKVGFTYPSRTEPSLVDVDLEIRPGQVIALVGENGSGKTTLAKLLADLYQPTSGRITWSGTDLKHLSPTEARRKVAVLFQDFVRYFLSAYENIALGSWEQKEQQADVVQAARRAGADDFLSNLPNGYETVLGPQFFGGSDLSGGQWQRVALSRAFFRRSDLVILDEPTAALDPRAEAALFTAVKELFVGQSVVLISHRFATVRLADHIYVLHQGHIVEHGSHKALMALDGRYAEMFTLQAAAFGITDATGLAFPGIVD